MKPQKSFFYGLLATLFPILIVGMLARDARSQYHIEGWPVKASWGPLRSSYIDPKTSELRFVFEDAKGTLRIVTMDPVAHTAVPVSEFKRE